MPILLEGEHRVLTALFADVKGSAALAKQVDVERSVETMNHVFQVLGTEIYRYGGEIDRYEGDGLVAFLGVPTAHEDDAERAILAALAMQEAVQRYAAELVERKGIELLLCIGLSTGEVARRSCRRRCASVGCGRRREAGRILAESYGWFTEGSDTADLGEAKVLLEQLARSTCIAFPPPSRSAWLTGLAEG